MSRQIAKIIGALSAFLNNELSKGEIALKTSEKIVALRLKAGFKIQAEFANAIGINPTTLSKYETGQREISIEWLVKFADFFSVSTDYLLGRTEIKFKIISQDGIFAKIGDEFVTKTAFSLKANALSPENRETAYKVIAALNNFDSF